MREAGADYRTCPRCGYGRTREEYLRRINVPWKIQDTPQHTRRASLCCHCRQEQAFQEEYGHQWDWAAALNKSTAMHVSRQQDGTWGNVTAHMIRVLDLLQGGRCGLTGVPFAKPTPDNPVGHRSTLLSWSLTLPEQDRGRIPTLLRLDPALLWTSGNVVLAIAAVEPLYRQLGGLGAFRAFLRGSGGYNGTVPAKDVVDDMAEKARIEQYEAWRKINANRVQQETEEQQ